MFQACAWGGSQRSCWWRLWAGCALGSQAACSLWRARLTAAPARDCGSVMCGPFDYRGNFVPSVPLLPLHLGCVGVCVLCYFYHLNWALLDLWSPWGLRHVFQWSNYIGLELSHLKDGVGRMGYSREEVWACLRPVHGESGWECWAAKRNGLSDENPFCYPAPHSSFFYWSIPIFLSETSLPPTDSPGALERACPSLAAGLAWSASASWGTALPEPPASTKVGVRPSQRRWQAKRHSGGCGMKSTFLFLWTWIWKLAWKLLTVILTLCRVWEPRGSQKAPQSPEAGERQVLGDITWGTESFFPGNMIHPEI